MISTLLDHGIPLDNALNEMESKRSIPIHSFVLVMNAGRSGSVYLHRVFEKNFEGRGLFLHEVLSGGEAQVRTYARAYEVERIESILQTPAIARYVSTIREGLTHYPVIEFGWRSFHLAPVFAHTFPGQFKCVFLHRHPVEFAASRAVMGFYGGYSVDYHEMNPNDFYAIHTAFADRWPQMNSFEKCLYWWLEFMALCIEFYQRYPAIPRIELSSNDLFKDPARIHHIADFCGLQASAPLDRQVTRNAVRDFDYEKRPLGEAWKAYSRHPEVLAMAERFGYTFDEEQLVAKMQKYQLPDAFLPRLRYYTRYWHLRHAIASPVKQFLRKIQPEQTL